MSIDLTLDPVLARFGPFELGWHGIFTALALLVAILIGVRNAERRGLPADRLDAIVVWGVVGGIIGARLFHVIDHLPDYLANPTAILAFWQGGLAAYGAFVGGVIAAAIVTRRAGLQVSTLLDAAAPAMVIGQAIGRLGCLANGDAWGAPCSPSSSLCVVYWHPNALLPDELRGVPTHPYPLYEIVGGGLLLVVLWLVGRRPLRPGSTFLVTAVGYSVIRFGLSFFRQETVLVAGLQEAQVVAVVTGLAALGFLIARAWDATRQTANA